MGDLATKDGDFECDLESGGRDSGRGLDRDSPLIVKNQAKTLLGKVGCGFADGFNKDEGRVGVSGNVCDGAFGEKLEVVTEKKGDGARNIGSTVKKFTKDKRKSTSNKKPPKPPRPPRGPSLDSADQKLVKEIADLAMMKRARNERMKAIKKMKAAKGSSSSGNILPMVFTALFCLVIIFQGMSSSSPASSFQCSPLSAGPADEGLISVQYYPNPSVSIPNGPGSESSNFVEQVTGTDTVQKRARKFG